jgi:heterodisulfide reductase subunit A
VEKEKVLGGHLRHIYYTIEGENVQDFLKKIIMEVKDNKLIHMFTDAEIESVSGFIGNYETEIRFGNDRKRKFKHGVVIVATGAQEYQPTEYLYGKDERIITQRELEERLSRLQEIRMSGDQDIRPSGHEKMSISDCKTIVMIQCVGSRDNNHLYCSRRCCSQAIKNALQLIELNPKIKIYILYRDVRTYGFKEDFYTKARKEGIMFIRYDSEMNQY